MLVEAPLQCSDVSPSSSMDAPATSLRSNQWSCSELLRGAELCADLAGLSLTCDPNKLSRDELLRAIEDLRFFHSLNMR